MGASVFLYDNIPPQITSQAPASATQWTNDQGATHYYTVSATDTGLGVKSFTLQVISSSGTVTSTSTITNPCTGDHVGGYCPTNAGWTFGYTLPEGQSTVVVTATDAVGNSSTQSWTELIDRTPPVLNVAGPIADAALSSSSIGGGPVDVGYDAADMQGNESGPTITTSGVVSVELTIDGTDPNPAAYKQTQTCSSGNCTMDGDFTVDTSQLSPGNHTFVLTATDGAGNVGTSSMTVTVNPTQAILQQATPQAAASTPVLSQSPDQTSASTVASATSPALQQPSTTEPATEATFDPSLATLAGEAGYVVAGNAEPAQIGTGAADGEQLDTDWGPVSIMPVGISGDEAGAVENGTTLNYGATQSGDDTFVRPTVLGTETFEQLLTPASNASFSWTISLAEGQTLQQLPDGSVAVLANTGASPGDPAASSSDPASDGWEGLAIATQVAPSSTPYTSTGPTAADPNAASENTNANNTAASLSQEESVVNYAQSQVPSSSILLAVIRAPWVVDALGQSVPAGLSVNGATITLSINTTGELATAYPLTASEGFISASAAQGIGAVASPSGNAVRANTATGPAPGSFCDDYTQACAGAPNWSSADAWAYAHHVSGDGRWFSYEGDGDDCTNYVSLILHAGGVQFKLHGQSGPLAWWTDPYNWYNASILGHAFSPSHTHDFTTAADFWHWAISQHLARIVTDPNNWETGDVQGIIYNKTPGGDQPNVVNHLQFVTSVGQQRNGNPDPYFTQHSRSYPWNAWDENTVLTRLAAGGQGGSTLLHIRFYQH